MRKRIIDGREAVPVRLIPFIAGWGEFAPDGVAKVLSSGKDGYGFEVELTAYHQLSDGTYKAMLPREWDAVATYLEVLTKKLKKEDKKEQIKMLNSEAWRKQSIEKLPSFAFVWLDDFKTAFNEVMSRTTFAAYDGEMGEAVPTERPGDKELNLSAPMTFDEMETVFAEFPLPYPHEEIAKLEAELNRPNQVGYTIRGAAAALSKKYGIDENSVRDSLFEATKHGKLPVRKTESGFTYTPRVRRDFLERVSIDDLNKFFEAEGVSYRLEKEEKTEDEEGGYFERYGAEPTARIYPKWQKRISEIAEDIKKQSPLNRYPTKGDAAKVLAKELVKPEGISKADLQIKINKMRSNIERHTEKSWGKKPFA